MKPRDPAPDRSLKTTGLTEWECWFSRVKGICLLMDCTGQGRGEGAGLSAFRLKVVIAGLHGLSRVWILRIFCSFLLWFFTHTWGPGVESH